MQSEDRKEYFRQYREKNKEKMREYDRKHRSTEAYIATRTSPEYREKKNARRRLPNPRVPLTEAERKERKNAARRTEEHRVKDRAQYAANEAIREANRAQCHSYYRRKKEEIVARMKEYNQRPEVKERNKQKNREYYEKVGKAHGVRKVKEVTLGYVRERIVSSSRGLIGKDIPIELLEAKQAEIKLKRLVDEILPPEKRKAIAKAERMALRATQLSKQKEATLERRRAQAREKYQINIEKARQKNHTYQEKNKELIRAKAREKYHANKEEICAKRRNISPEERAHINALARAAVARRKLKNKLNQEGVSQ
jgi:hypothetical protein